MSGRAFLAVRYIPKVETPVVWLPLGKEEGLAYSISRKFKSSLALGDSKSEGCNKIGSVSFESCSQSFEETRRIQDPVQFAYNKTSKTTNRIRI